MTSLHVQHIQQPHEQQGLGQRKQPKAMVTFESHIWKQITISKVQQAAVVKKILYQWKNVLTVQTIYQAFHKGIQIQAKLLHVILQYS